MAKQTGSIDLRGALQAYAAASSEAAAAQAAIDGELQFFWHDDGGAHVLGSTNGRQTDVKSDGLYILDVSNSNNVVQLAKFTDSGSQIGKSAESHVVQTPTSWNMVDADRGSYATVEDIRGVNGTVVTEWFTDESDGGMTWHLSFPNPSNVTVKIGNIQVPSGKITVNASAGTVTASVDVPVHEDTSITYTTDSHSVKAYTFGYRTLSDKGVMSFSEGTSDATGMFSHSEGRGTISGGDYSHSEGFETEARGLFSHAQNIGTVAAGRAQTVIGTYNEINDGYAFIIGRGWDEGVARDNALAVNWNGDIVMKVFDYGDLPTSEDIAVAIRNLGWESEVYE